MEFIANTMLETGLRMLIWQVNGLVDSGEKEEIDFIEQKMKDKELFKHLEVMYPYFDNSLFQSNSPYPVSEISDKLAELADYAEGRESRKYAVSNNGLNLIIALCVQILADA